MLNALLDGSMNLFCILNKVQLRGAHPLKFAEAFFIE